MNRRPRFYAAVFLLCLSVLALQICQARLLSVAGYYHLAFFAISMATFGLTAGAFRDGPPITTLGAEKFLVRYPIGRSFGSANLGRSKDEIATIYEDYGICCVLFQTGFWTDVPSIRRLDGGLRSDLFATVAEFPIVGAEAPARLVVFGYKGPVAEKRAPIVIDVLAVGRKVEGGR
jgi:hypothetical protein